jgi:hypothetical protein
VPANQGGARYLGESYGLDRQKERCGFLEILRFIMSNLADFPIRAPNNFGEKSHPASNPPHQEHGLPTGQIISGVNGACPFLKSHLSYLL